MIRQAELKDTEKLIEGILAIWRDMEAPFVTEIPLAELKEIISESMKQKDFRFHYANGIVYEIDGKVAGVAYGYKGEMEEGIDQGFKQLLIDRGYHHKINLTFDLETEAGEWYLDMLYTYPDFRKQGVATKLLDELPVAAEKAGETAVGLNCDVANPRAKALYEKKGYRKVKTIFIVGHEYDHMVKNID